MHMFARFCAAIGFSLVACGAARAVTFDFALTGSRNASFSIDTDTLPTDTNNTVFGSQIFYDNVLGMYGVSPGTGDINFGQGPVFADLNIGGTVLGFTQFAGPTLFGGPLNDPTFNVGTFDLTSLVSGDSVLTITEATAVPEPMSIALLLAFAVMAVAIHERRRERIATA